MRLTIVARGRIGRSPEAEIVARYAARLPGLRVVELGERDAWPPALERSVTVVLDERGAAMTSMALAAQLASWAEDGVREARFLLGGADGHDAVTRADADLLMGLGAATWPHMLARAMLAEQLWRATSINAGHPYHRE